jgi:hypothetical protein
MSPEDLLNQALVEIGYERRIGDIYEGSPAAAIGLEIFSQTRDEVLRHDDWPFARKTAPLSLVKTAVVPPVALWDETSPPPPWMFSYVYPPDCIYLRYLRFDPLGFGGGDPLEPIPIRFAIVSDLSAPGQPAAKTILANLPSALAIYTSRITDPLQWEPLFLSGVVKALAAKFVLRLGRVQQGQPELAKEKVGETGALITEAGGRQG